MVSQKEINLATIIEWMEWNINDLLICCQQNEINRLKFIDELGIDLLDVYDELCSIHFGEYYEQMKKFIKNPSLKALRKIPLVEPAGKDIYANYRYAFLNEKISYDFNKSYKLHGIILSKDKWKKRLKNEDKLLTDEEIEHQSPWHCCITSEILSAFEYSFINNFKGKTFWCFMTSIISEPLIRKHATYPLITPADVLKIYSIGSAILNKDERKHFFIKVADIFLCYSKEDIYLWKDKICNKNVTYKKLLNKAYQKKKKYVFND